MLVSDGGGSGLFLSPIPVPPGDPGALSHGAAAYAAAHGEIDRNRAALTAAASQAGGAAWTGAGAAAYVSATSQLAACYALTAAALARGATTLRAYSASLATAKQTARQANAAVAKTNAAATALLAAQAAAAAAQTASDDASQSATTAEGQAAASPHSASAQAAATTAAAAATDAQSAAATAQGQVAALTAQYDADRALALRLCSLAEEEARQAAARAAAGFDAAANELMGQSAMPVRGGAEPVSPGQAWNMLITTLAGWNGNRVVGGITSSLGVFGAIMLGRAQLKYLESVSDLAGATTAEDDAFRSFLSGDGSLANWLKAADGLDAATKGNATALKDWGDAITSGDSGVIDALGKAGLGIGIASDLIVLADPGQSYGPDGLFGGRDDRIMAGANLAASGLAVGSDLGLEAATAALAIPGVDVVVGGVLIGTAAYFAGEYVYTHYGSDIAHLGEDAWNDLGAANNWVNGKLNAAGNWVGNQADDLGHDVGKVLSWL